MVFAMKELKRLWLKYLKKQHGFMLCKYDRNAQRLRAVIKANAVVILAKPYGITKKSCLQGFTRPSEFALDVIRAMKDLVDDIHSTGYCLDGKLSIHDLFWLSNKKLKLSRLALGTLKRWEETRAENDYFTVHNLIRDEVFKGHAIPSELDCFMRLLVNNPIKYEDLILHNIILLDDAKKIGEYISCYQQLQQIQKLSEVIYRVALTFITERIGWKQNVHGNSALMDVLTYNHGAAFKDKTNCEGPVIFGRHCCNHLLDYSVDEAMKKILFTIADEFAMVELCIPGIFAEVQRAVFEVTHILFPKELAALRATNGGGVIHHK